MSNKLVLIAFVLIGTNCYSNRVGVCDIKITNGNYFNFSADVQLTYKCEYISPSQSSCEGYLETIMKKDSAWIWYYNSESTKNTAYHTVNNKCKWSSGHYLFSVNKSDTLIRMHSGNNAYIIVDSVESVEYKECELTIIHSHYTYTGGHKRIEVWQKNAGMIQAYESYKADNIELIYSLVKIEFDNRELAVANDFQGFLIDNDYR